LRKKGKGLAAHHGKKAPKSSAETGAIIKSRVGRISVALVYPNTYSVGMSSLGFQTLYRLFNEMESVVCERVFVPEKGGPPRSVETKTPLAAFDIVAFSLSFENDYPFVLTLLGSGGIPIPSAKRDASHPLIMAGGVACFLNPEPLAEIFDLFLLGEAEANLESLMNLFDPKAQREDFLRKAGATVKGAYVPHFYSPLYNADNTLLNEIPGEKLAIVPLPQDKKIRVHRAFLQSPGPVAPVGKACKKNLSHPAVSPGKKGLKIGPVGHVSRY